MSGRNVLVTLKNRLPEIRRLSAAVEAYGEVQAIPDKVVFQVNLALDELLTNIISYGYADGAEHEIAVRLSLDQRTLTVEIEDDARPFNPLDRPPPDLEAPLEARPIGGLGVHLVRTFMDSVEYRQDEGRNRLTLRKTLA